MEYTPDRDGMAWISLHLPGDTACAIWNRTTATARGLQGPNEPRSLTQLRPDIAASLLLGAGSTSEAAQANGSTGEIGKVPTPRADVLVMVPVCALLGVTDEPAELDGHGPIPASMARKLVADGADSFYRVLVDPRDGAPLEIGRTRYRLTETIKQWIRMRDGKCTFPGCSNRSPDNDTDHLTAWEHGGTTGTSNLAQLCPKHHRLKHARPWIPDPATHNGPAGWTSPTGRHYNPEHPDREPTRWPPGLLPSNVSAVAPEATAAPNVTAPSVAAASGHAGGRNVAGPAEDLPCQPLLAGTLTWLEALPELEAPELEEPDGDNLLDPDDLCATDALWDDFYAMPFVLPPDPQADWQLLLSLT
jgi:hypothetical protein